jgi:glucosamine--fructose-6-phosphate aminotransferase (isomerizing)
MCGIVGIIGSQDPKGQLLDMLHKLEYRGYDSAGVAVNSGDRFAVAKRAGRLEVLEEEVKGLTFTGHSGIGHTRWATHGAPTDANAHPLVSQDGSVAIVHNGIIENYREVREELKALGYEFTSDTDSEVICYLADQYAKEHPDFTFDGLVGRLSRRLKGAFAILMQFAQRPGELFGLRFECPLSFVNGAGVAAVSSDISSLVDIDRRIHVLSDGQAVHLRQDGHRVIDFQGRDSQPIDITVDWDVQQAEKEGFPHFLRKEISEQPQALKGLRSALNDSFADMQAFIDDLSPDKVVFLACGSASYSCAFASVYARSLSLSQNVFWDIGSEFRYKPYAVDDRTLFVCVSQSGETADTISAFREARNRGAKILSFVNVVGSTLDMDSDLSIRLSAGPEIAVPSTKAVINQFASASAIIEILSKKKAFSITDWNEKIGRLADCIDEILKGEQRIQEIAKFISGHQSMFVVGRGLDFPVSMEAALKLKETAYIHAEAMYAGEFKHGSISLIEYGMPVLLILGDDSVAAKSISNGEEVKARGAQVVIINGSTIPDQDLEYLGDVVGLPPCPHPFNFFAQIVVAQLLAYHAGVFRRIDVDKPRNLAKSVTVE